MKKVTLVVLSLLILLPVYSQEKKVITVLDFSVNNVSENDMKSITSFLSAALFDTGQYRVIDASQRSAILAELSFSASGCVDESCQLEIGKLLSAEMIVVGDIGSMGGRYILTAKLLDTETSDTVKTAKGIYADLGELLDDMYVFANDLAGAGLGEAAPPIVIPEPEPVEELQKPAEKTAEAPAETVTEEMTVPANIIEKPASSGSGNKLSRRKIIGLTCLAGGVIASGVGGYLISDLFAYYNGEFTDAQDAYDLGSAGYAGGLTAWDLLTGLEQANYFEELYTSLSEAGDVKNGKLTVSAAVTGGGVLLLGVGALLYFLPEKTPVNNEDTAVSFLLEPGVSRTSFGLSVSY